MTEQISKDHFLQAFLAVIDETFAQGRDGYLDRGTSLFETLATVTAEEASRPASATSATIAAHVAHLAVALDFSLHFFRGERLQVDWTEAWRTVHAVTDEEWRASQEHLRATYAALRELVQTTSWQNEVEFRGAMGLVAHSAYHLGEIRRALCTR